MIKQKDIVEALQMQPLSEEEKTSRHILGRLYGPIATCKESTRNGRRYNKALWEKALSDDIFQEKINNKSLFLELGHPADREETDMEKVCACIPEAPKIVDDELIAYVDILDTANGRLLKTLCDYGFIPGISSRGSGEVIGDEVDPESFYLETWDIVQTPAVKGARLSMAESLDTNKLNLKMALCESLNSATEEERKVMKETLQELDIEVEEEKDVNPEEEEHIEAEGETSEQTTDKLEEANNDGSEEIIKSLQEALKAKSELEAQVKQLQEQLAVSDAKVGTLEETVSGYKSTTVKMSTLAVNNKEMEEKISTLEEQLDAKSKTIESQKLRISKLVTEKKESMRKESDTASLNESLSKKDAEIKSLNENFDEIKKEYESKIQELNESIETLKIDSESNDKELRKQLADETRLKESYHKLANNTMKAYIESKAIMLGVDSSKIIERLPKHCTVSDVDSICESLQSYELDMNKLPFSVDRKVKVTVSKSTNESLNPMSGVEDDVDESLLRLAKLI